MPSLAQNLVVLSLDPLTMMSASRATEYTGVCVPDEGINYMVVIPVADLKGCLIGLANNNVVVQGVIFLDIFSPSIFIFFK